LSEVEASGEPCVAAVTGAAFNRVAPEQAVILGVTDDRLDHRTAFQPTFDFISEAAFLARIWTAVRG
jgi:hypothetical protein